MATATKQISTDLSEQELHTIWMGFSKSKPRLDCGDGFAYSVVYAGRHSPAVGPDFKEAIIRRSDGATIVGDVEIHRSEDDWRQHGHHQNPDFNSVVLHIVAKPGRQQAETQNGQHPITIAVDWISHLQPAAKLTPAKPAKKSKAAKSAKPKSKAPKPAASELAAPKSPKSNSAAPKPAAAAKTAAKAAEKAAKKAAEKPAAKAAKAATAIAVGTKQQAKKTEKNSLEYAGVTRFINRVSGYRLDLMHQAADQVLYAAMLECLGYGGNRRQFTILAALLPYHFLKNLPAELLQNTLLWAAGFGDKPDGIELSLPAASKPTWSVKSGRPHNHPRVRLAGFGLFLQQLFSEGIGIFEYCVDMVRGGDARTLHEAFQSPLTSDKKRQIGKSRAQEILANAILPAIFAYAELGRNYRLARRCLKIYKQAPAASENALTKAAAKLFNVSSSRLTACEQQGLLHLYKTFTNS